MRRGAPFDPKRLLRPLRWVLLAIVAIYVFGSGWRYSLLKLPEGVSPLFDVHAGDRAVVMHVGAEDAVEVGHIVLWRDEANRLHLGRVVAVGGDRVAVDGAQREARRVGDEQAYPLPDGLNVPTQLAKDQVLVLAENALTRGEGGLVDRRHVEFRVLGVLPF